MALREPQSMDEIVYYTDRAVGEGEARVWVFRQQCPKCKKALMGKPRGKNGKVKTRASEYECPECGHTVEKKAYEESLTASVAYTCPGCKKKGEAQTPFKRKLINGVQTLRVDCDKCGAHVDVTKKMKE